MDSPRLIAHLDMDAFYASVELLRYPELRGKPVAIGGGRQHQPSDTLDPDTGVVVRRFRTLRDYAGRGVLTTATYEARALGLHSAQPIMRAKTLAPDAILLPVDFDAYRACSRRFKAAVAEIAPVIEDRGIDEIYIDLTHTPLPAEDRCARDAGADANMDANVDAWARAACLARLMKQAVRDATGLTCSVAVAPNKLLAKIASELDKPDGLTILRSEDIAHRVWPLPARKINGIGPKASAKLASLNIHTIGELAAADPAWLVERFGRNFGAWLHDAAHGRDDRPVVTDAEPKSISRELTFERDLSVERDRAELSQIFSDLCAGVAHDLARKGYAGRTIGLKLRFDNFKTVTRDCTLPAATADAMTIRRTAGECLKRVTLERRIRLLGVRVGHLVPLVELTASSTPVQLDPLPLFDGA